MCFFFFFLSVCSCAALPLIRCSKEGISAAICPLFLFCLTKNPFFPHFLCVLIFVLHDGSRLCFRFLRVTSVVLSSSSTTVHVHHFSIFGENRGWGCGGGGGRGGGGGGGGGEGRYSVSDLLLAVTSHGPFLARMLSNHGIRKLTRNKPT